MITPSFLAVFAAAMRKAFTVHNYSDHEISLLLSDLTSNVLGQKRRKRGGMDLSDLERILLAPLVPLPIASYETHYFRTDFGYLPDEIRKAEIKTEQMLVIRAARRLMRHWRRATFWKRFLNLFIYVGCPACNYFLTPTLMVGSASLVPNVDTSRILRYSGLVTAAE